MRLNCLLSDNMPLTLNKLIDPFFIYSFVLSLHLTEKNRNVFLSVISQHGKCEQLLQKPGLQLLKVTLIYISTENESIYCHNVFLW